MRHFFVSPLSHLPEEFENGAFTLKTHQMLSVHTTLQEFRNAKITGHFGFVLKIRQRDHTIAPFSKCVSSAGKRKAGVFKFCRFEERFREAPFSKTD